MNQDPDARVPSPSQESLPAGNGEDGSSNRAVKRQKTELKRAREAYLNALVISQSGQDGKVPPEGWTVISDDIRRLLGKVDKTYEHDMERANIFAGLVDKWSARAAADKETKSIRRVFLEDCAGASTGALTDEKLARDLLACDARTLGRCRDRLANTPEELTVGERAARRTKQRSDAIDTEIGVKIKDFIYSHCKYNADKNPPKHLHVMTIQQLHQLWCQTHDKSGTEWPYGTPAFLEHRIRLMEGEVKISYICNIYYLFVTVYV
jgi:hypothetical protein